MCWRDDGGRVFAQSCSEQVVWRFILCRMNSVMFVCIVVERARVSLSTFKKNKYVNVKQGLLCIVLHPELLAFTWLKPLASS